MSTGSSISERQADGWQAGDHRMVMSEGLRYHTVTSGEGPVVVLVAGFPQSSYAWRKVVPFLADKFTIITVDLPGQGDSDKPLDGYDTRTTAKRIDTLLKTLGHDQYVYIGHDIGAWVGFALAHDHADSLRGIALIDGNIPGVSLPSTFTLESDSWRRFHFLFNAVQDLPEALLAGRERIYIEWFFQHKTGSIRQAFTHADLDEYERAYSMPGGMRGMLNYYRAVVEDIEIHTEMAKNLIQVPLLAVGADEGSAPDIFERMKPLGTDVRGGNIADSGHYIPEEQPEALANRLREFLESLPGSTK
ncbi:alpha/beta fold hydrolase [Paenarthrobacter sp. RAF54_2]|uniref:alpha/beta fold hydrolase n=1 Tax=Paenarthrobacter sp. RAF54_2 TaxID=3233061 RepID=UPI003F9C4194